MTTENRMTTIVDGRTWSPSPRSENKRIQWGHGGPHTILVDGGVDVPAEQVREP